MISGTSSKWINLNAVNVIIKQWKLSKLLLNEKTDIVKTVVK